MYKVSVLDIELITQHRDLDSQVMCETYTELISRLLGEIDAGSFVHMDNIESKIIPVVEDERNFKVVH